MPYYQPFFFLLSAFFSFLKVKSKLSAFLLCRIRIKDKNKKTVGHSCLKRLTELLMKNIILSTFSHEITEIIYGVKKGTKLDRRNRNIPELLEKG